MDTTQSYIHDMGNQLTLLYDQVARYDQMKELKSFHAIKLFSHGLLKIYEDLRDAEATARLARRSIAPPLGKRFIFLQDELPKLKVMHDIDITLIYEHCSADVQICSDDSVDNQIMRNAIQNSVKAGARAIHIEYVAHKDTVDIFFRDNGRGIRRQDIHKLGSGYSTSGGGCGVRIIKALVAQNGGIVQYTSIPPFSTELQITMGRLN